MKSFDFKPRTFLIGSVGVLLSIGLGVASFFVMDQQANAAVSLVTTFSSTMTGPYALDVAVDHLHNTLYVSNFGCICQPGTNATVAVFNALSPYNFLRNYTTFGGPRAMSFDSQSNRMYIAEGLSAQYSVINTTNNTWSGPFDDGTGSSGSDLSSIAAFPGVNPKVYTSHSGYVQVLNASSALPHSVLKTIAMNNTNPITELVLAPGGIPNGTTYLYALEGIAPEYSISTWGSAVDVIDTSTDTRITQIPIPSSPGHAAYDNNNVYVTYGTNSIAQIDKISSNVTLHSISGPFDCSWTPSSPGSIIMDSATGKLLVAAGSNVCEIDPLSYTQLSFVSTGQTSKSGMAIEPSSGQVFVANKAQLSISVISEIANSSISIAQSSINFPLYWGVPTGISGTSSSSGASTVDVNWGDGQTSQNIPTSANGSWAIAASSGHVYNQSYSGAALTVSATLKNGNVTLATSNQSVLVSPHPSSINLNYFNPAGTRLTDVVTNTGFTVGGTLVDALTSQPLSNEQITFSGSGASNLPSVATQGMVFSGGVQITSCAVALQPNACQPDAIGFDPNTSQNNVLLVPTTATIVLPPETVQVNLYIQDMSANNGGTTNVVPFTLQVTEGNEATFSFAGSGVSNTNQGNTAYNPIPVVQLISGSDLVDGVRIPHYISSIKVQTVSGSSSTGVLGLAAIKTSNPNGNPADQHVINFESADFTVGNQTNPYSVNSGSFFAMGIAQTTLAADLSVIASFNGDATHAGTNSTGFYSVLPDTSQGGFATNVPTQINDAGTGLTAYDCVNNVGSADTDSDAICDAWEGGSITYNTANYPLSTSSVSTKDLYYEIDYQTGYKPSSAALAAITTAFQNAPGGPISVHFQADDEGGIGLPVIDPLRYWTDAIPDPTVTITGQTNGQGIIDSTHQKSTLTGTSITIPANQASFTGGLIIYRQTVNFASAPGTISGATAIITGGALGSFTITNPTVTVYNTAVSTQKIIETRVTFSAPAGGTTGTTLSGANFPTITVSIPTSIAIAANGVTTTQNSPYNGFSLNDFDSVKKNYFGTPAERQTAGGTLGQLKNYLLAKDQVYHYVLFGKNNGAAAGQCGSSGEAEGGQSGNSAGNDVLIALGCGFQNTDQEVEGTLMHEMGHNLGLRHGGGDDDNCKPNYDSVMSYARQMPAPDGFLSTTQWSLDYSHELAPSDASGPINENGVIESTGLPVATPYYAVWHAISTTPIAYLTSTTTNIDWNQDGAVGIPKVSGTSTAQWAVTTSQSYVLSGTAAGTAVKTVQISGPSITIASATGASGAVVMKSTITLGASAALDPANPTSISVSALPGASSGLAWGVPSVSVTPTSASTTKTIVVTYPFTSTQSVTTAKSIGSVTVKLTTLKAQSTANYPSMLSTAATASGSPFAGFADDLNYFSTVHGCDVPGKSILSGFNDWSNLKFNFRSAGTMDGFTYPDPRSNNELNPTAAAALKQDANITPGIYIYNGPDQPLNDIAYGQPGISVFKGGNTIPLKFHLQYANGTIVKTGNFQFLLLPLGKAPFAGQIETQSTLAADTGNTFRFSSTTNSWIFNLGTKGLGSGIYAIQVYQNLSSSNPLLIEDNDGDGYSMLFAIK